MECSWYALQVKPRCESSCESLLTSKGYEVFLPRYNAKISHSNQPKVNRQPLFPGYLFCRLTPNSVGKMVMTPGAIRLLGIGNRPEPVADAEIESLRRIDESDVMRRPWQYLPGGSIVEIMSGPLSGVQGVLETEGSARRIVVSVTLLHRSVCAELDEHTALRPLGNRTTESWNAGTGSAGPAAETVEVTQEMQAVERLFHGTRVTDSICAEKRAVRIARKLVLIFAALTPLFAQPPAKPVLPPAASPAVENSDSRYLLGPDDEISVWVGDVPDLSANAGRALTIDANGNVNVPMAGVVKLSGTTTSEAERIIAERLTRYIKHPQVSVSLTQMRSRPVSVVGSVNSPGVHQIRGETPLLEVIAKAGGLRNDAGSVVTLTRPAENGPIPLPFARRDASDRYSVAEISLDELMRGRHPEYNTPVKPNDVVSVRRAEMVYVVGDVKQSGGFVLNEKKTISVLQALSLAGGIMPTAAPGKSKIIRNGNEPPEKRVEIAVDLKQILGGQQRDLPLYPDDILFVPDSSAKKIALRSAEAILQTVTGVVIFRSSNR